MKNLLILLFPLTAIMAQPDGAALLDQLLDIMNPGASQSLGRQIIETTTGQTRTFEFDSYTSDRGRESLIRYRSPSRMKGDAVLMTEFSDNIWMYYSRTNRVRKLASHAKKQKFQGSDFTYEDMGSGDTWKQDYTPLNTGEIEVDHTDCYRLELTAAADDLSYSRMLCIIRQSDAYPLRIEYYDKHSVHTKTLYLQDIREIEGYPTAMKMVMENHLDRTSTIMETVEITFDVTFDEKFFSERNLKK